MNKDRILWYIRQLQLLRYGFINEVDVDMVEHHVLNYEDGLEKAMEAVCGVYTEIIGKEVQERKEVKHV